MIHARSARSTFRKVVLTFGTVLAVLSLLACVPKIISSMSEDAPKIPNGREWEGQVMTAMFYTFILGYGVGWWKSLFGGALITLSALVVSVPFVLHGNYGALIFGIPLFACGLLYLSLDAVERRRRRAEP